MDARTHTQEGLRARGSNCIAAMIAKQCTHLKLSVWYLAPLQVSMYDWAAAASSCSMDQRKIA